MTLIRTASLLVGLLASLSLPSCGEELAPTPGTEDAAVPAIETSTKPVSTPVPTVPDTPPNILVFLIDTQRADFLETYGHDQPTSPNIKAFSEDALVFERAYAAASSTSPSHASIFTSTYPQTHGVWNRVELPGRENPIYPSLAFGAVTLAEVMLDGGYATAGICDGGNLQNNRGLAQGFDFWDSKFLGAENRVNRAFEWLGEERDMDSPFFLFLHTYQVHTPYLPKPEYVEMFADPNYDGVFLKASQDAYESYTTGPKVAGTIRKIQRDFFNPLLPKDHTEPPPEEDITFLKALYQAEIRQMDTAFGELIAWLKENDLYEDTLIIVTSDHGEEFWEHGTYGHHQVYDTTMHVPFIVRAPGGPRGERRSDPIELIDLMPTLVHIADLPAPDSMMGKVLNWNAVDVNAESHEVIGESNWPEHQISWRVGEQKAMLFPGSERASEVFRTTDDPGEKNDLAASMASQAFLNEIAPQLTAWMKHCIDWRTSFQLQPGNREQDRLSPAELAEMEALGYVDLQREKNGSRIIRPPRKRPNDKKQ